MNPSLLSPTPATGSALRRFRTIGLAFALALFTLLLWDNAAHAEDALDPGTSASAAPAAPAPDADSDDDAVESTAPVAPADTPEVTTTEPADEPAPAEAVATHDAPAPALVADEVAPAPTADEADAAPVAPVPTATTDTIVASPPARPGTGRTVPVGFVQATLMRAQAHSAPAVHQCNADTFPTSAGWEASCVVTVENTLGGDGSTGSRVTTTWCLAEAGVLPPEGCTTDVSTFGSLVTTVDQCNGILAGGSNVTCSVEVINNVPFGTPTTEVTVNQCIGSGQGGVSPGGPPTDCEPVDSSTTDATVTQCNGSANGGGGPERVRCAVTGGTTALPVTVNQCNGSTAAGSTVTCDVTYTNNFAAAAEPDGTPIPTPTPTPTLTPISTPTPTPVVPLSSTPAVVTDLGQAPPSGSSTSSPRSVTGPSSGTATSLAATGASSSTPRLLVMALLLLILGGLLLGGARRPSPRP